MTFKRIILTSLLACLILNKVDAQQSPVFADYNYNTMIINSAYTGFNADTELLVSNTGFFNKFEGSPKTLRFTFQTAINEDKMGFGAGFSKDEIGVTSTTNLFAAYSYKIFFDLKSNRPHYEYYVPTVLSFGVTAGLQIYNDDLLSLGIENDPNFNRNVNANVPTFGFGIVFNNDRFYAGVSSPNLLGDKLANEDILDLKNTYYGYFGYRFYNNRFEDFMLKPSILLKYEKGAPLQIDTNISISYHNRFELGTGYRTNSSVSVFAGLYLIKNFRLIYHYNIALNENPLGNMHGIVMSFKFGDGL